VLFQFLDETQGKAGRFVERTAGSIIIPVLDSKQHKTDRWGKVVAVGPMVDGVSPGDYVLIEALQWSFGAEYDGQKIWRTIDTKIIVVTDDLASTITPI
jgi:hypothetical protein